jgi:VanZ family protein
MSGPRSRVVLAAIPVVGYMALIFVLSSRPPPEPVVSLGVKDSWLHLVEYGVLGFLVARLVSAASGTRSHLAPVVVGALVGTLYGLSDEWHQSFVPGRDASASDAVMDAVGSTLGALLHAGVARIIAARRTPAEPRPGAR